MQRARGAAVGGPVVAEVGEEAAGHAVPGDLAEVGLEGHAVVLVGGRVHEALVVDDHAAVQDGDADALAGLDDLLVVLGGPAAHGAAVVHGLADVLGVVARDLGEDGVHDLAAAAALVVQVAELGLARRQRHVGGGAAEVVVAVVERVDEARDLGVLVARAEPGDDAPALVVRAVEGPGGVVGGLVGVLLVPVLEARARRRRQHVEHARRHRHAHLEVPGHGEQRVHLLPEDGAVVGPRLAVDQAREHEQRLEDEDRLSG